MPHGTDVAQPTASYNVVWEEFSAGIVGNTLTYKAPVLVSIASAPPGQVCMRNPCDWDQTELPKEVKTEKKQKCGFALG